MLVLPRRHLKLAASPPERLHVGEAGATVVEIEAARHPRATRVDVLPEQRGALDPADIETVAVAPATSARVSLPMTARRRGRVFIDALWLRWRGPLSLVQWVHRVPVNATVDVATSVRGVRNAALQFHSHEAMHGMKVQQQKGEGSEFEALRDYLPGLDPRHVDWKHSARHRRLLCKEFQTERNHPVVMAFDTGHLMLEPVNGLARPTMRSTPHWRSPGYRSTAAILSASTASTRRCGSIMPRSAASPGSGTSSARRRSSPITPRRRTSRSD
jgi:uncharacterized protein (DUF58 family)